MLHEKVLSWEVGRELPGTIRFRPMAWLRHLGPALEDQIRGTQDHAADTRSWPAVGAEGADTLAHRGGEALAALLGVEPVVFPGDHGGFAANEWSPANDPAAFARKLREVLDGR